MLEIYTNIRKQEMFRRHLKVEVADTPSKHQQGLMFRHKLEEDDGKLFKFRNPHNLSFWGLNTFIPLAIAFVSSDNIIEKISYISPNSTKSVSSDSDCVMAIEANYDFFDNNKVIAGDKIFVVEEDGRTLVKFDNSCQRVTVAGQAGVKYEI